MRGYSAPDLERLRETTNQPTAQAQSARQKAANEVACYRAQAERFKALPAVTHLPKAYCVGRLSSNVRLGAGTNPLETRVLHQQ
jgi:hypothetical protein